jgi:hypothetical protein
MLLGKLGNFPPTHVDISGVNILALVTWSQIGEKLGVWWRGAISSPIFFTEITTQRPGLI